MFVRLRCIIVNEDIGLPAVQALATPTNIDRDRRPTTAQDFLNKQAKDLYFYQRSSTVGVLAPMFHYDREEFLFRSAHIDKKVKKLILSLYGQACHIPFIIQDWQDTRGIDVVTTQCSASIIGHI